MALVARRQDRLEELARSFAIAEPGKRVRD